jgi:hypothetical protein
VNLEFVNAYLRVLCLLFIIFPPSCFPETGVKLDFAGKDETAFRRMAVVPFQRVMPEDASIKTVSCPISGKIFMTCKPSGGVEAEKVVEKIFLRKLEDRRRLIIIPTDRTGSVYKRISADSFKVNQLEILQKVGTELEADGVIIGYIYRYRERKGYPYSVEKPASVAFCIHLIRVSDGAMVWKGIFDRTQGSLMENILQVSSFLNQGGKWLTAEELSEVGVNKILETFPDLQKDKK